MTTITMEKQPQKMRAWVVFSGQSELWWVRMLRRGFRHCYVIMHDGRRWLSLDPLSSHLELGVHDHLPEGFDLSAWVGRNGAKVLSAPITPQAKCAPIGVLSCVEVVKRFLGIHAWWVVTPWQLYRFLIRQNFNQNINQPRSSKWEV